LSSIPDILYFVWSRLLVMLFTCFLTYWVFHFQNSMFLF
jgi:hypothetical protein